jgi:hypothetical protein
MGPPFDLFGYGSVDYNVPQINILASKRDMNTFGGLTSVVLN